MNLNEARTLAELRRKAEAQESVIALMNTEIRDLQTRLAALEARPKRGRPRKTDAA